MELNLETIEDVRFFKNNWSTIYKNNKALDNVNNLKVVIPANLLSTVLINEENKRDGLYTELALLKNNFVKDWIEEHIEIIGDKSEEEIRKDCLKAVKEELANLKSEKDLNSVDLVPYNFMYMLSDVYNLTPEVIVNKVEKDLAELESN